MDPIFREALLLASVIGSAPESAEWRSSWAVLVGYRPPATLPARASRFIVERREFFQRQGIRVRPLAALLMAQYLPEQYTNEELTALGEVPEYVTAHLCMEAAARTMERLFGRLRGCLPG
jgi:hypothetical protein